MRDLSHKCIFNGTTENLNTIMTITYEGEKYKIAVCEECEDDASPGAIKKLIPDALAEIDAEEADKLKKLAQLQALAKELGVSIGPATAGGLTMATSLESTKTPEVAHQPARQSAPPDPNALDDKPTVNVAGNQFKMQKNTRQGAHGIGLSAEETKAALEAAKRRSEYQKDGPSAGAEGARVPAYNLPSQASDKQGNVLDRPVTFAKQMQTIKGRQGVPVTLPRRISGSHGETIITINQDVDDKMLKERGRSLGQMADRVAGCRPCRGAGVVNRKNCIHCNGKGITF